MPVLAGSTLDAAGTGRCRHARSAWARPLAPGLLAVLAATTATTARAATIVVDTFDDLAAADGACSLREAITAANADTGVDACAAGAGADTIVLSMPGTIQLAGDLPALAEGLTLRGLGVSHSVIEGGRAHALFVFPGPATGVDLLRIEAVRLVDGLATRGGAIDIGRDRSLEILDSEIAGNHATTVGGAINARQAASVHVERSTLSGNVADRDGGAIALSGGQLSVVDSTFFGNISLDGSGGAVHAYNVAPADIRRSTFSANRAADHGGALHFAHGGAAGLAVHLDSLTVVDNVADHDGDDHGWGGGIDIAGNLSLALHNSVVARNRALVATPPACDDLNSRLRARIVSSGYNLVGNHTCAEDAFPVGMPNATGDFSGAADAALDPQLGPLQANGGPTLTRAPLPGSVLLDAGDCPGEAADQRGISNPATGMRSVDDPLLFNWGDGCDIGAVETAADPIDRLFHDGFDPDQPAAAANASRVRFSGATVVQTTSSSMRMPPYLRNASTLSQSMSRATGWSFRVASSMSTK